MWKEAEPKRNHSQFINLSTDSDQSEQSIGVKTPQIKCKLDQRSHTSVFILGQEMCCNNDQDIAVPKLIMSDNNSSLL